MKVRDDRKKYNWRQDVVYNTWSFGRLRSFAKKELQDPTLDKAEKPQWTLLLLVSYAWNKHKACIDSVELPLA